MNLVKGTLWRAVLGASERALSAGALLPVPTEAAFIEDGGMRFFVRVLSGLARKDEARKKQDTDRIQGGNSNPFLPPEQGLVVAGLTDTHMAILNKFNVVEHHLLIITRRFEDQDLLLTPKDFEALWLCLAEYDGLGFYNGGREAGASQQHKHLQVVPLPLAPAGPAIPIEPLLDDGTETKRTVPRTLAAFPFLHSFVRLDRGLADSPSKAAKTTFELYGNLLASVGMTSPSGDRPTRQSRPYCFLVTRDWLLLAPRSREYWEGISFNSLAFAGSLFVRNEAQLDRIKAYGPMNALKLVSVPRSS